MIASAKAPAAVLRIVMPGEPVGKGRARFVAKTNLDGTTFTKGITPTKTRRYEDQVRFMAQLAVNQARWRWDKNDRFAVVLRVHRTYVDRGPDLDNVIKILDALNGVAWKDDRHVWAIDAAFGVRDPKNPRLEIEVRRFPRDHIITREDSSP